MDFYSPKEKSPVPAHSSVANGVNGAGPQSGRLRSKLPEKKSGAVPSREASSPLKRPEKEGFGIKTGARCLIKPRQNL